MSLSLAVWSQDVGKLSSKNLLTLKTKAGSGDVRAQVQLGRAYEVGDGVPKNEQLAVKWYRAAADKGDAEGQNDLGTMYRAGLGVDQDKAEAVHWYQMAAQQGYAPAMYNLGTAYYNGDGVPLDDVQAYAYFILAERGASNEAREAARRSESELLPRLVAAGQIAAVQMLTSGVGVPANSTAAVEILRDLNKGGDPKVLLRLATMAREGRGLPRDSAVAYRLCKQAAEAGDLRALLCVAEMNETGEARDSNGRTVADWYLQAVRAGSDEAAIHLAELFSEGRGVTRDRTMAYLLLKWAALDSERAKNRFAVLKASMSETEIKTSELAWQGWRP